MPDSSAIATALREELIAAGLVRHPSTPGALPPLIVQPRDGAPAPGDRDAPEDDPTLVVSLLFSGELGEAQLDGYRRRTVLDVRYRSVTTAGLKRAHALDAAIRNRLVNRPDLGLGWTMGAANPIVVLSSSLFGGLSPITSGPEGTDEVAKYMFEVLA